MTEKTCTKCGEMKAVGCFYKRLDGLQPACKDCSRTYQREYRSKNGDFINARGRKYRVANIDASRESTRKYHAKNRDASNARARKNYTANADSVNIRQRKWHTANPEKVTAKMAVRKAVKNCTLEHHTMCRCTICFDTASEYHHWSYAEEHHLDVFAMCRSCHMRVHADGRWNQREAFTELYDHRRSNECLELKSSQAL